MDHNELIAQHAEMLAMLKEVLASDDAAAAELAELGVVPEGEKFEQTEKVRALIAKVEASKA
jgi:hypothetical protein